MTVDEALSECVAGARMTAPHMQPGCYIEHSLSRGFIRCWPVDRPEDEPQRTQCEFRAHDGDRAADWTEVVRPAIEPPKPSAWANFTPPAAVPKRDDAPPINDVIDLTSGTGAPVWAPSPGKVTKGGW